MKTRTRWLLIFVFVACQVTAFFLLFPNPAYADDCLRDPLNAADCMRTTGARQVGSVVISLAGTLAATLVSVVGSSASTAATATSAAVGSSSSAVEGAVEGAVVAGPPIYMPVSPVVPGDSESAIGAYGAIMHNAGEYLIHSADEAPAPPPAPAPPQVPEPSVDLNPPPTGVEGQTPQLPLEPPPAPTPAPVEGTPSVLQGDAVMPLVPGLTDTALPGPLKDLLEGMVNNGEQTGQEIIKNLPEWVDSAPFDILKNAVGTSATLAGTLKEYVKFVDSPETIQAIHDALHTWQNNPTTEAAEEYLKQLGKTTDSQVVKLSDGLDHAAKGIDVIEAVGKGLSEAEKEGFTGEDKAWAIGGELAKKYLTWQLTKNPVFGAVDWIVGTATQAKWGKEGRVDIGGLVDKAGDKWKDVVKEYTSNTGGAPEAEASSQTADQFLSSIRRIKQQVNSGQISKEEGSIRAHKLQQILMGGAQ